MGSHQVLEFTLGWKQYCIDIEYIAEVVSSLREDVSSIPDSPPHVEGELDFRGETTRIIDPRARLLPEEYEANGISQDRMIVFDTEMMTGERSGWMVTDVLRIVTIDPESVEAVDEEIINGIVALEDEQVVWIDPGTILDET
ncbi:chemotaxis protein CheW [Halorientalis marina]|jgi:purine-binding chemotaxis protein CheW|uniref:chemotaxis protein CheW n=1 Tax=Halorientalis marina TaxID=2931976 RepID=UPI001FF30ABE|nr:chemotaxis protein CheW [Halorientalis marina]